METAASFEARQAPSSYPTIERFMSGICERLGPKFPGPTRLIIFGEASLYRYVKSFLEYYHESRTHLSLGKDAPEPRAVHAADRGAVVALPQVGGLHHRYERRAA